MIEYYKRKALECERRATDAINRQMFEEAHYWQGEAQRYYREIERKKG